MNADAVRVLFVCNANECRSPLAQWGFVAALRAHGMSARFAVASAGVRATPGRPMLRECAARLDTGAPEGFRSRAVTAELLVDADVVVTMTRAELAEVLRLRPQALRRAVTLVELARCAGLPDGPTAPDPATRLVELVGWTIRHRGQSGPFGRSEDDIPDPVGQSRAVFDRTVDAIARCLDRVVGRLRTEQATPVELAGSQV